MRSRAIFRDRFEAGSILADKVREMVPEAHPLVLALPRGGVPVGFEVAQALHADLDIFLVRKLGVPGHEELAFGALASGGVRVLNPAVVDAFHLSGPMIEAVTRREQAELERRERLYRQGRPAIPVSGRTAILVDDGLATGASMLAAARALRQQQPARIVVAVPVAAPATCEEFRTQVDQIVCAATPEPFHAVGIWYENFDQTSDDEVRELLERAAHPALP